MDPNFKERWSARTHNGSKETLDPHGVFKDKQCPFDIYIYPNLLDTKTANQLRDDINASVKLRPKDNDLYKFKQSKDLRTEIPSKKLTPLLHKFIDMMIGDVREHLEKTTPQGKLSDKKFDITASRYDVGNYLLCHNDDVRNEDSLHEGRRALAFVYYLNSRPWTNEDGGALILYDSDKSGEPVAINNYILPKPNTLVVFETYSQSWHSVEEVYCKDDFRLSINGWFRSAGRSDEIKRIYEKCPHNFLRPIVVDERVEKFFKESFNQDYLMEKTCMMIRKRFKRKSEINLTNFLVKEKFEEIEKALREATSKEDNLAHIGPYNKRNYRALKLDKLPQICKDLYDAFRSELFFMLLSRLTGLDLQPPSIKNSDKETIDSENNEDDEDDEDEEDDEEDEDSDDSNILDDEDDSDESITELTNAKLEEAAESSDDVDKGVLSIAEAKNELGKGGEESTSTEKSAPSDSQEGASKRKAEEPTTSKDIIDSLAQVPRKRKRKSDPMARLEFRHFETGSYTLIHDFAYEMREKSALDVMLHFNHNFDVNFEDGGYISYIDGAPDEDLHDMDYELLTIEPKSNCLSLVYRCDEGTCRFLKHLSKSHKSDYQDLCCVYYEKERDLPKDEDG